MYSRYDPLMPDYALRAFDAWYGYGADDEKCEEFAGKWGGLEYEHFLRALEQGEGDDRLLAMFALGASADPDAASALLPFLPSARRDERCVSAIVLGMRADTRAYPFLEKQLLEGLSLEERIDAFARDDQEVRESLYLCDRFRPKAVELLEAWHSPTLIQALIQTLQALWVWEKASSRLFDEERAYNALLYALGQRGVFTFLDTLHFPPMYQKIAMVYLALGALQIRPHPRFAWSMKKKDLSSFLKETFCIDGEEAQTCIEAFYLETEVQRAYRYGLEEQAIEELFARHFIVTAKEESLAKLFTVEADKKYLFGSEEEDAQEQEEEPIEQKEPVRVCFYREHTSTIWSVAWSPDGSQIASGGADTTAQVWNWQTSEQTSLFQGRKTSLFREHTACVTVVAWSPDGQWVASGGCDNKVFIWNAQTGEIITTYTEHNGWICNGLGWSPDGACIASASWDGSVHIWEAMTGKTCLRYLGHQGVVTQVAWSPDGTQVASGGGYPECAIHVWNATTGQLNVLYTAHMQDVAGIHPASAEVLATDEAWMRGPGSLRSVVWSPDGRWIASADLRYVFRVWDAQTGEDLIALEQNHANGPLAWSADSTYLAAGNQKGVDFWNIGQKKITLNYTPVSRYSVTTLAWSPDRRSLVTGVEHPRICVWEVDLG